MDFYRDSHVELLAVVAYITSQGHSNLRVMMYRTLAVRLNHIEAKRGSDFKNTLPGIMHVMVSTLISDLINKMMPKTEDRTVKCINVKKKQLSCYLVTF